MSAFIAIGLLFHLTQCFAQPSPPAFEAATVKPNKAGDNSSHWNTRTGYLNMRNQTLKSLVAIAWHVKDDQVSGGPKWIATDRFDLEGRAGGPAGDPELIAMLQTLLVERFQLAVHRDTKTGDGFALVLAQAGGLKIPADEGEGGQKSSSRRGTMEVQRIPMTKFAETLSRILGAPVVDMTPAEAPGSPPPPAPSAVAVHRLAAAARTETRNQETESRYMVVVDKAEKPSENQPSLPVTVLPVL